MRVTVVVPTYNRATKLGDTLDRLLRSDTTGIDGIEILVVDDGSATPASAVVETKRATTPFRLACIRQDNAGPAAARNRGFRASRGEVVLFVDDDILVPPDLIRLHVDAHRRYPGAVVCGRCPLLKPTHPTALLRFLEGLGGDPGEDAPEEFLEIKVVASGQISMERSLFDTDEGVYREDLATPAAEEFELSHRLLRRGIPTLLATRIVALHDQSLAIASVCLQQHKHAVGCAEAALKYPATRELPELARVLETNRPARASDSALSVLEKVAKGLLAQRWPRAAMLLAVGIVERVAPHDRMLSPLYRAVLGLHVLAGFREGWRRYSEPDRGEAR